MSVAVSCSRPRGVVVGERYQLLDVLARGGMGSVYEAIDRTTNRLRAVKVVDAGADADLRARFEREAVIAGRVESRHLVEIVDAGYDAPLKALYLVMERLRGEDLGAHLARVGRLSKEETLEIASQVARGLGELHEEGIVHRDVKPENVFLTRGEDGPLVKIVDLGLAKSFVLGTSDPKTTRALGTPLFMAPEQLAGDGTIDHRADVYALGHLVFAMLVGKPYGALDVARAPNLYALLLKVAEGPRESASARARALGCELPPSFDAWFALATSPSPADRFDTCDAAISALGPALAGESAAASSPALRARPSTRRRIALAACATAAVTIAAIATLGARRAQSASAEPAERAPSSAVAPIDPPASTLLAGPSAARDESPPRATSARPQAPTSSEARNAPVLPARTPRTPRAQSASADAPPDHDPLDSM